MNNLKIPTGRLARWAFDLQQYHYTIQYRKGTLNKVADALSRQPRQPRDPSDSKQTCAIATPDKWLNWENTPQDERKMILLQNHDEPTRGHLGIEKTAFRIASKYYWSGMFRDISKYVRACQRCQQYKPSPRSSAEKSQPPFIKGPWDTATANIMGPLPRSTSAHAYVLVM